MLKLVGVTVSTPERRLFGPLTMSVARGEIVGLAAPSGSGKSVLLRWLLGALPDGLVAQGSVHLNEVDQTERPTHERQIGLLLQQASLFPHLSVGSNLAFAMPAGLQREQKIQALLAAAGLDGFEQRDPATLSGGQQARVALLRALAAEPKVLLLDEPFSSLDPQLRSEFRAWVFGQIAQQKVPALVVSHDREDLVLCDRVLTLNGEHIDV